MNMYDPFDARWQRRVLLAALVVFAIALQPVTAAVADGGTRNNTTQVPLEELLEIEVEKVYSASRFEQSVTEAPASVSIVTADDIKKVRLPHPGRHPEQCPGFLCLQRPQLQLPGSTGFQPPRRLQHPGAADDRRPSAERQHLRPGPDRHRIPPGYRPDRSDRDRPGARFGTLWHQCLLCSHQRCYPTRLGEADRRDSRLLRQR